MYILYAPRLYVTLFFFFPAKSDQSRGSSRFQLVFFTTTCSLTGNSPWAVSLLLHTAFLKQSRANRLNKQTALLKVLLLALHAGSTCIMFLSAKAMHCLLGCLCRCLTPHQDASLHPPLSPSSTLGSEPGVSEHYGDLPRVDPEIRGGRWHQASGSRFWYVTYIMFMSWVLSWPCRRFSAPAPRLLTRSKSSKKSTKVFFIFYLRETCFNLV